MRSWIRPAALCALASLVILQVSCEVTRKPDGTITVKPADGEPIVLPPERVKQIEIEGQCYYQFKAPNGVWYCFPCDQEGDGYAEPCSTLIESLGEEYFLAFMQEWAEQEEFELTSEYMLEYFDLGNWSEGNPAAVPMALSLLDTDIEYIEVVIVGRSDWEWPDNNFAAVEVLAFPDASGYLPDLADSEPDAVAFLVSGDLADVADAIARMFVDGFIWQDTYDGSEYVVEADGSYYVEVREDDNVVWNN